MNRQYRRQQAKATPAYRRNMTTEDKLKAFYKNGITVDDLQRNHEIGFNEGWRASADHCLQACYAAVAVALKRQLNFTPQQCASFVQEVDTLVATTATTEDALQQALGEAGLELDFSQAFAPERICVGA